MTNEDLENRAKQVWREMRGLGFSSNPNHFLDLFARHLREGVSQAYEEAAQMAESMPLRHARFDFECAQESARAIRALRDSLQPEGEVTGV